MGTVVTISAYGESRARVHQAITKAFEEIHRIDTLMSVYKPESQLSLINRAAGRTPVDVDTAILDTISSAKHFHDETGGAFDITVEPLMELWGFRDEPPQLNHYPSDSEISKRLNAVGFQNIIVNEAEGRIGLSNPHSKIDLGGIAVGYSVDRAVAILKEEGIRAAFINHSGDAFALGAPDDAQGWSIAIPNPEHPSEMIAQFVIRDRAVSTSGNYEKYVTIDAKRLGHILDPQTGRPSDAMKSATLFAPTSTAADALSTGLFCMSLDEVEKIVRRSKGLELFAVSRDGKQLHVQSIA
jgi:thiamine biosynthesis lipoprotein